MSSRASRWSVVTALALATLASPAQTPSKLPPGITLPISLDTGLSAKHAQAGQRIDARLTQRVPMADGRYLPAKSRVEGTVVSVDAHSLKLRFDTLVVYGQSAPISTRLVAAAYWLDVDRTRDPLDGGDRGTSSPADWTTMQIGRDEVYRSAGAGTVYDQYSQPVGHADLQGVYAAPRAPGGLPRAMGPFSTTAKGLYNLPALEILSAGGQGQPIELGLSSPKWKLDSHTALLLEVVAP